VIFGDVCACGCDECSKIGLKRGGVELRNS
jgi:hypothetical protein